MSEPADRPDIGIVGGTGFYSFLANPETVAVATPFGSPSAEVAVGEIAGRRVAFLPRHGQRHQFPPHRVNYRANLWALRSLGVRQVLAPCAVGSLEPRLGPGAFVLPDQLVDRTWGRQHTVYDGEGYGGEGYDGKGYDAEGPVVHVGFADPYCPRGRQTVLGVADGGVVDGGTLVVINGPRFSSKAESAWHAGQGWSLVGMTGQPEAALARELAMCYTSIAMVTDHDAGIEGVEAVTHADVLRMFAANIERLKVLLHDAIAGLPQPEPDAVAACGCRRALDGLPLPFDLP